MHNVTILFLYPSAVREELQRNKDEGKMQREADREKIRTTKEETRKAREEKRRQKEVEKELNKFRKKRKANMMGTPSPIAKKKVKPPKSKEEALALLKAKKEEKDIEKALHAERVREIAATMGTQIGPVGTMMMPIPLMNPMAMAMQTPLLSSQQTLGMTCKSSWTKMEAKENPESKNKTRSGKSNAVRRSKTTPISSEVQEAIRTPHLDTSESSPTPPVIAPKGAAPLGVSPIFGFPGMPSGVSPNSALFAPVEPPKPGMKKRRGRPPKNAKKGLNAVNPRKEKKQKEEEAAMKSAEEAQREERLKAAAAAAAYYTQMAAAWKDFADREAKANQGEKKTRKKRRKSSSKKGAKVGKEENRDEADVGIEGNEKKPGNDLAEDGERTLAVDMIKDEAASGENMGSGEAGDGAGEAKAKNDGVKSEVDANEYGDAGLRDDMSDEAIDENDTTDVAAQNNRNVDSALI